MHKNCREWRITNKKTKATCHLGLTFASLGGMSLPWASLRGLCGQAVAQPHTRVCALLPSDLPDHPGQPQFFSIRNNAAVKTHGEPSRMSLIISLRHI